MQESKSANTGDVKVGNILPVARRSRLRRLAIYVVLTFTPVVASDFLLHWGPLKPTLQIQASGFVAGDPAYFDLKVGVRNLSFGTTRIRVDDVKIHLGEASIYQHQQETYEAPAVPFMRSDVSTTVGLLHWHDHEWTWLVLTITGTDGRIAHLNVLVQCDGQRLILGPVFQ